MISVFNHTAGYIPGREQLAMHSRFRYRLVSAPPGVSFEPGLEIVHYMQTSPEQRLPANRVVAKPNLNSIMMMRSMLDQAGPIDRKEFMLHDAGNWPRLNVPNQRMPPNPYPNPMMGRPGIPSQAAMPPHILSQPAGMRPPSMVGPSPAKRARVAPVGAIARPLGEIDNPILAEEETAAAGDVLDLMSPRDLSAVRFKQHHEWMEEILASPYATSQITPVRVHFPMSGELGNMTREILEPTDAEGQTDRTFSADKVAELEKRVQQYQSEGEEEMARMKAEHGKKMEAMKEQREFAELERQLSEATRNGGDGRQSIQVIIEAVEKLTRCKVATRDDVVQVQKGGQLQAGEELMGRTNAATAHVQAPANMMSQAAESMMATDGVGSADEFADFANLDTAGEALQDFYTNSYETMDFPS